MKKIIYKTNQYLLERFPTIWNTRLVWMLLTALILHFIFFIFGFFTLTNPEILQEQSIKGIFFNNGTVFLTSIISILLLVGWLINMFKNNAFKNFYPTTSSKLFGQFLAYILIIFSCSTFFLSYNYGIKTYIASTYSNAQINKQIKIANDAALFFSKNISDYTIDKRRYPKPFYDIYCEKTDEFIDYNQPFLEFNDQSYQFYSLYTKEVPLSDHYSYTSAYAEGGEVDSIYNKFVYSKVKDSLVVLYFKDSVVNILPYIKTSKPSYYNSSFTFFISKHDTLKNDLYNHNPSRYSDYDEYGYNSNPQYTLRHQLRSKRNYELLERNDKAEIEKLLESFLEFSNYYRIPHNLIANKWVDLVYQPHNFEVKNFIRTEPKNNFDSQKIITTEQTKFEKFYTDRVSDYYFKHDALSNVFENIEDIKFSNPFIESIHFFMWFSFLMACIIFMFRITGLKPLLFSVITVGVLTLFMSLMAALLFYVMRGYDDNVPYVLLYLILFISTLILAIPLFFINRIKKIIVAICVNVSIMGLPLYLLLIISIISLHQSDACRLGTNFSQDYYCNTLMKSLDINWSYVLLFLGILFIFFYSKIIKKWKSLPEA